MRIEATRVRESGKPSSEGSISIEARGVATEEFLNFFGRKRGADPTLRLSASMRSSGAKPPEGGIRVGQDSQPILRRDESKAARVQPWGTGVAEEPVDAVCSGELGRGVGNSWAGAEIPKNECVAAGIFRRRHLFMSVFKMFILINKNRTLGQTGNLLVG